MDFTGRINRLKENMAAKGFEALLVTKPENVYYLSGFYSTSAAIVITEKENTLATDGRYFTEARKLAGEVYKAVKVKESLKKTILEICKEQKINKLGFEENYSTYADYKRLNTPQLELKESGMVVEELRLVKDIEEIGLIQKAADIISKSLEDIRPHIEPGITERDLAAKLDCLILSYGASGPSFETIVASGPNSAVPHHEPGGRTIKEGEFVMIDAGARFSHYCSDMTRTFIAGKPDEKLTKLLDVAEKAQEAAIGKIRTGVKLSEIDRAARQYISANGYGDNFIHNTGHGIGLEVHEGPGITKTADEKIRQGMILTIEPGIYIEGLGGVRIEDMVAITGQGVEKLT